MAHKYRSLQAIMKQEEKGWFKVHCPTCKESRKVEPDGYFTCKCNKTIRSPLLSMGMI